jgi:hypothetical protein
MVPISSMLSFYQLSSQWRLTHSWSLTHAAFVAPIQKRTSRNFGSSVDDRQVAAYSFLRHHRE